MSNSKKHLLAFAKAFGFIASWIIIIVICSLPAFDQFSFLSHSAALLRLWLELLPMIGTLLVTYVFLWGIERGRVSFTLIKNPLKNTLIGLGVGCLWLGGTLAFLFLIGALKLDDKQNVSYLALWFLAVLLNVIMQEYLVRGYLFSLFRKQYNTFVAVAITTIIFTAMHGGAFESGIVAVLNIITTSIFLSLLLVYTQSLLASIIAHFIWNGIGCIVFGVVSLAEDYPSIWNCILTGNNLISGGSAKIEGRIIVLLINIILIIITGYFMKRQRVRTDSSPEVTETK